MSSFGILHLRNDSPANVAWTVTLREHERLHGEGLALDAEDAREEHPAGFRPAPEHCREEGRPARALHGLVGDHDQHRAAFEAADRRKRVRLGLDPEPGIPKEAQPDATHSFVVVHEQYVEARLHPSHPVAP